MASLGLHICVQSQVSAHEDRMMPSQNGSGCGGRPPAVGLAAPDTCVAAHATPGAPAPTPWGRYYDERSHPSVKSHFCLFCFTSQLRKKLSYLVRYFQHFANMSVKSHLKKNSKPNFQNNRRNARINQLTRVPTRQLKVSFLYFALKMDLKFPDQTCYSLQRQFSKIW